MTKAVILGAAQTPTKIWAPSTPAEIALYNAVGHYVGIEVPGDDKGMKPLQIAGGELYLEHYFTEHGARHVHSVSMSSLAKLFEEPLTQQGAVHEHLVAHDPEDKMGYHKYFAKWKAEGLI